MYPRKRKWRLKEQDNPEAHLWQEPSRGADDKNYPSAAGLADAVEAQLELSVTKGQPFKLTEEELAKNKETHLWSLLWVLR